MNYGIGRSYLGLYHCVKLLSKANRSIGILEGVSRQVATVELFVSMYVRKEALLSSQIEGAQATLDDILDPNIEENTNQNVASGSQFDH